MHIAVVTCKPPKVKAFLNIHVRLLTNVGGTSFDPDCIIAVYFKTLLSFIIFRSCASTTARAGSPQEVKHARSLSE